MPDHRRAAPHHIVLSGWLYLFFGVFLVWPILQIVSTAFWKQGSGFTLQYIALVFHDPLLVRGLLNSATVAVCVTMLTLLIALPLAILNQRYDFAGRKLLGGLLLVPLVLPPFVGAIGMRFLFSRLGPLSSIFGFANGAGFDWLGKARFFGVIVVEALALYPVMLLNLQAALANIDPAMEQAALNLGASRWTAFRRITLPLIRPGLFAGCTIVMIWSFTELGTPLMFDFNTVAPVQVFNGLQEVSNNPMPFALVVVLLMASTLLYIVGKLLLGRNTETATTKAATAATPKKLTGLKGMLALLAMLIVFVLAVEPHVMVLLTSLTRVGDWYRTVLPHRFSLGHYRDALTDELVMPSIWNSIRYASAATVMAVMVGLGVAVVVVRSNVRGRNFLDILSMLPLAVPGLVLAFGYLAISVWAKQKFTTHLPGFLDVQENPAVLLIIAYACRRLPYVVRSAVAGLQQTPRDLELAAGNLGASKWRVLGRITLPLIAANLIAGALLAFAFALLEVSDSLILAQKEIVFPITRAIYALSQRLGDGLYTASALGVWAMVFLTLTILLANSIMGKKMGAIFRV